MPVVVIKPAPGGLVLVELRDVVDGTARLVLFTASLEVLRELGQEIKRLETDP